MSDLSPLPSSHKDETTYTAIADAQQNISDHTQGAEQSVNTTLRHALYGCSLLLIITFSVTFWAASLRSPILFSLSGEHTLENHAKSMTFVWTLIGTVLAFTTSTLFNQLLKVSVQQTVAAQGLRIGLIEFWTRIYARKWLKHNLHGRFVLAAFTVIFAIATGLLVSAYTGLITPTKVYVQAPLWTSELDVSSDAFGNWYSNVGVDLLSNCSSTRTYGKGASAITLAMCPQVKDPLPYVSAGLASIESRYAKYDPTTSVIGMKFNGTTKGVLPHGWNSISYFNSVPDSLQPPVAYNYSTVQQGISANVSCVPLGQKSNITWQSQGEFLSTMSNGMSNQEIFIQNFTYGNKAKKIPPDNNLWLSSEDMIASFQWVQYGQDTLTVNTELAAYGSYRYQWQFPNMTCSVTPYLTNVNVTYNNATGLFGAEIVDVPGGLVNIAGNVAEVGLWLFRVMQGVSSHQIVDSIAALQNTPSYKSGIFANVTIDWPSTMELFFQGVTEYQATYLRMILSAEINSTNIQPAGFHPLNGTVASWRLGYNGETAPIATLFPIQGFILLCAIFVVVMGARTGVKHVSGFDPTNTTHLIVASALGGRNGGLGGLRGENAIHADARALDLKVGYSGQRGFQESSGHGEMEFTDLLGEQTSDQGTRRRSKPALFARRPFQRTRTG